MSAVITRGCPAETRNRRQPTGQSSPRFRVSTCNTSPRITVPLLRGTERAEPAGVTQRWNHTAQPHPPALSPDPRGRAVSWWTEVCFPAPPPADGPRQADEPALVQPRWQLLWGRAAGSELLPPSLAEPSGCLTHSTTWSHRTPRRSGGGALLVKTALRFWQRSVASSCSAWSLLLSLRKLRGHLPI